MGLREAFLFGSVLLLSCVGLCVASEHSFSFSTNETLNQTPQEEEVTVSSQLQTPQQTGDHQSNRTGQGDEGRSPVSYRLRSFQLRNPAVGEQKPARPLVGQMQTFHNPERSEARKLTSEQLEPREPELLKGPDLNPPVKQEPKVHWSIISTHNLVNLSSKYPQCECVHGPVGAGEDRAACACASWQCGGELRRKRGHCGGQTELPG